MVVEIDFGLQWNAVDNAWQQIGADLDGESAGGRESNGSQLVSRWDLLDASFGGQLSGHVSVHQWTGGLRISTMEGALDLVTRSKDGPFVYLADFK